MVQSIRFLGVRTDALAAMRSLYGELLGAEVVSLEDGVARFRAADGTTIEVYAADDPDHQFFGPGPVVGFRVEDFAATRARMVAAGIAFVGEPERDGGAIWNHFIAPDGNVYEIIGADVPDVPVVAAEAAS
jgi:catechol 2,3-dioxygenase-like lactoylglutathione lyase family enzyme